MFMRGCKVSVNARPVSSGDVMYSMVTLGNNTVLIYLKFAKRVES